MFHNSRFPFKAAGLLSLMVTAIGAQAASLKLDKIDPPARIDLTKTSLTVNLTGSGFSQVDPAGQKPSLQFSPAGMITATNITWTNDTTGTATFTLSQTAAGKVKVTVITASFGNSNSVDWDTGVEVNQCIEALQSGGCSLRWEVEVTGVTNSSNQTSNNTTPNILTTLNYQYQRDVKNKQANFRMILHGLAKAGYTQISTATKVQPTSSTGSSSPQSSTTSSTPCPSGSTSTSSSSCMAVTPQQAFVAELGGTFGTAIAQNGQGTFSELGIGVRGSLQDVIQSNQIVQSGGLSYVDLTAFNSKNVVGLYEAVGRYRLAALNHDKPSTNGNKFQNSSNLLLIEAGFQYNSGLQQLAANPATNTKNRFVGRFYLYPPELPGGTHTKVVVGMEYSGGINGGPKVIQIFWGTNLNPARLLNPVKTSQ